MVKSTETRVSQLHIDRRIRRVLAFEIAFVFFLYIILFLVSNLFLSQQNRYSDRVAGRFQMMVNVQNLERYATADANLAQSYRLRPTDPTFQKLVKNHGAFGALLDSTKSKLEKTTTAEATRISDEVKLIGRLQTDYLKSISTTNALVGKEVLSPVAAFKIAAGGQALPTVASTKTPDELEVDLNAITDDAEAITANWRTLIEQDISHLQNQLGTAQKLRMLILLVQAVLVMVALAVISYSYVLPSFEGILAQIVHQNEELLRSDVMKTEFISIASHQLRTPLSVIKWSLALVLRPENSNITAEQRDLVSQSKNSADTVIKLVSNLLNLSRIEQGRLAYTPVPTDLVPIIERIMKDVQPAAAAHDVTLTTEHGARAVMTADPLLIKEVIQNLVDNAISYNKPKGTVQIGLCEKDKSWLIEIADTGYGITPEDQQNLFTKFFRGMNARAIRPDGSGLGLYFIHKIIALHGGTIKVESEPDQGTIFTVVMPKTTNPAATGQVVTVPNGNTALDPVTAEAAIAEGPAAQPAFVAPVGEPKIAVGHNLASQQTRF